MMTTDPNTVVIEQPTPQQQDNPLDWNAARDEDDERDGERWDGQS